MRRGHPVLSRGLTRGQFKRLDHILVASRASAHRLLDDVLAEVGLLRQPYLTLPHFTAAAEIVRRTDLTVTLPRRVAVVQPRARLRGPPLPLALPELTVTVHWHARFDSDPGSSWLRRQVVETLADREPPDPGGI